MSEGALPAPSRKRRLSLIWKIIRPYARVAFVLLALGLIAWVLTDHSAELAGASAYLTHIRWEWLVVGIAAELGSIVAYGLVQQRLIEAGGVPASIGWLTGVTLANIAITNSLPTGSIVATIFTYRQYRHKGSDEVLAAWAIVALLVVTSVTLAIVAATGVAIAGSESSNLDLVGATIGILVVTLAVGALFVQRRALIWMIAKLILSVRLIVPRLGDWAEKIANQFVTRLTAVKLSPVHMFMALAWGLLNWVLDCGCLVLSFVALGVGVPWRGLLLAYGAGQLAANLPITPGGLGVVEGSLTVALVAYGGAETSTVAAVFLYRLVSFWGELPVGWVAWAWLARQRRRSLREVEAATAGAVVAETEEVSAL